MVAELSSLGKIGGMSMHGTQQRKARLKSKEVKVIRVPKITLGCDSCVYSFKPKPESPACDRSYACNTVKVNLA